MKIGKQFPHSQENIKKHILILADSARHIHKNVRTDRLMDGCTYDGRMGTRKEHRRYAIREIKTENDNCLHITKRSDDVIILKYMLQYNLVE